MPASINPPDFVRILFVEDNEERIELFKRWLPPKCTGVFVQSGGRALRVLDMDGKSEYAGICLDFDLNEQTLSNEREIKGREVVHKVIRVVPRTTPILIHSMNTCHQHCKNDPLTAT